MVEFKNLVFISTHIINKAVISEYNKLSNIQGYTCVLVIDNTNLNIPFVDRKCMNIFYDKPVNCFIFDKKLHDELNLPDITYKNKRSKFSDVLWYNADYRFYYIRKFYPNYDYYWQFDYDVFFNGASYKSFLDKYKNNIADLLIPYLRKEKKNSDWYWTIGIDWVYDDDVQIFASFFPVSRLTASAIDFLYSRRLEHKVKFNSFRWHKKLKWINCELFVPTELSNAGYICEEIVEPNIRFTPEYDLNEDRIFEIPDNKLYHPVKGDFLLRLQQTSSKIPLVDLISKLCSNFFN